MPYLLWSSCQLSCFNLHFLQTTQEVKFVWSQRGDTGANAYKCKVRAEVAHHRCVYTGYYSWGRSSRGSIPFFSGVAELLPLCGQTCNHLSRWHLYSSNCIRQPALVWRAASECSSVFGPSASAVDQTANKSADVLGAQRSWVRFSKRLLLETTTQQRAFFCLMLLSGGGADDKSNLSRCISLNNGGMRKSCHLKNIL